MVESGCGHSSPRGDHHPDAKPDEERTRAVHEKTEVVVSGKALVHNVCGARVRCMNHYDR